jgi:hypothetical protein
VGTWAFSPIKFQADMGILLAFMFVWNMVGALVLLPALAHFLLPVARSDQVESTATAATATDAGAPSHGAAPRFHTFSILHPKQETP